MLAYLASATSSDRSNSARAINAIVNILYIALTILAIFLAIRDMSTLPGTASKVWLFLLALCMPELYVIVHGLSTSSMGQSFFAEVSGEHASGMLLGKSDATLDATSDASVPSPVTQLAREIKKAAQHIHSSSDGTVSAASSSFDSLFK
jgi:hypothetical protein